MDKQSYLESHIPHRINLLVTFKERYSGYDARTREKVGELARDFFRCSKDISMLMVRFLLGELGITLKKGENVISEKKCATYIQRLPLKDVICDRRYSNILDVLKAANRAVAHMEEIDVNHAIQKDPDDIILINAIEFTKEACVKNIYDHNGIDYNSIMMYEDNNMHRDRLIIENYIK